MPAAAPGSLCCPPSDTCVPLGSEAAAAGLCAGQCILKVNGNNVVNDGAAEVLEHFQAFRSHQEEALVSQSTAKGTGVGLLVGWGAEDHLSSVGRGLRAPQHLGWGGPALLAGLSWAWALPTVSLNRRSWARIPHSLDCHHCDMGVIRPLFLPHRHTGQRVDGKRCSSWVGGRGPGEGGLICKLIQ